MNNSTILDCLHERIASITSRLNSNIKAAMQMPSDATMDTVTKFGTFNLDYVNDRIDLVMSLINLSIKTAEQMPSDANVGILRGYLAEMKSQIEDMNASYPVVFGWYEGEPANTKKSNVIPLKGLPNEEN